MINNDDNFYLSSFPDIIIYVDNILTDQNDKSFIKCLKKVCVNEKTNIFFSFLLIVMVTTASLFIWADTLIHNFEWCLGSPFMCTLAAH